MSATSSGSTWQRQNSDQNARTSVQDLAGMFQVELGEQANGNGITFARRRIQTNRTLYRAGDIFDAIFVVRFGFLKAVAINESGIEHVLAFPMTGNLLGLDGLASGVHHSEMTALDESEVVVLPVAQLAAMCCRCPALEILMFRLLGCELSERNEMLLSIGTLTADARVARFLLRLGMRHKALGYSEQCFTLRMTREDIGKHLGLKLETVSRSLSSLQADRLLHVERREIRIVDRTAMTLLAHGGVKPARRSSGFEATGQQRREIAITA